MQGGKTICTGTEVHAAAVHRQLQSLIASAVTVTNPTASAVTVTNPTASALTVTNPTASALTVTNPTASAVTVTNPTASAVTVTNPTASALTATNPTASALTARNLHPPFWLTEKLTSHNNIQQQNIEPHPPLGKAHSLLITMQTRSLPWSNADTLPAMEQCRHTPC